MKYFLETDRGKRRAVNQDSCAVFCPDAQSCFAIVCDGMGGANAGEIASAMVVENVVSRIKAGWREGMSDESVQNLMLTSITAASINVYDQSVSDEKYSGMGTTVVACAVKGDRAIIAHAGDSRAYICDESELRVITKDHSLVQELVDLGQITKEEAKSHPRKNYITRALGVDESVEIDFNRLFLSENEKLLLCTDGLTNFVPEEDILQILHDAPDPAKRLVEAANANGGGDNITAVVISLK